jgi:hypothetical protein
MKKLSMIFSLIISANCTIAQFGEIRGVVTDKITKEPLAGATVTWTSAGHMKGTITNEKGEYKIKPLTAGAYDLSFSYVTYKAQPVLSVLVSAEKITWLNMELVADNQLPPIDITWTPPIVDPGVTSTMSIITADDIKHSAVRDVRDHISTTAGVFQREENGSVNIRGSRESSTLYIVDGVRMREGFSIPKSAIAEITVITGGIPAQFGDATGGVVLITTKSYRR